MLKLFFSAFFKGPVWKWFTGSFSTLLALVLFGKNYLGLSIFYSSILAVGVLFCILILFFVFFVLTNTHRQSAYGDAIVLLKDGFAGINKLKRDCSENNEEIMAILMKMCDTLKAVFDRLTRAECSVSIKIPINNAPISGDTIVENICRNHKHYLIRSTDEYKKQVHWVNRNTAYQEILGNVLNGDRSKFYYLNNNVPKTKGYNSTSRQAYPDGVLPYKSEIVYPILPVFPSTNQTNGNTKSGYEIWGFLCIDCTDINKFNERYHIPIIEGVADGVFDVIMKVNKSRTVTT